MTLDANVTVSAADRNRSTTPAGGSTYLYDIANLSDLPHLRNLSSTTMSAFENFDRAAMAAGAIPRRYKN
ncbi:hypothetical protein [Bradyrhizobium sp. RDI18]|uniref:hypothetical protein n=1 Tax=Bradyrhizobium sp. RDI18 TaxID=3367400 RepID=UPI0037117AEB